MKSAGERAVVLIRRWESVEQRGGSRSNSRARETLVGRFQLLVFLCVVSEGDRLVRDE